MEVFYFQYIKSELSQNSTIPWSLIHKKVPQEI